MRRRCPDCGRPLSRAKHAGAYHCDNSWCHVISVIYKKGARNYAITRVTRAAVGRATGLTDVTPWVDGRIRV